MTARTATSKLGQVPVLERRLSDLAPSPENDRLYRPIDPDDPDIQELAASIEEHGVCEPLVVSEDGFIISGHRRYAAAELAGLTSVPCRVEAISRLDEPDRFLVLLREYNRQREKSIGEQLRESILSADPYEAHEALLEHRRVQSAVDVAPIKLRARSRRHQISEAKRPLLDAVQDIIYASRKHWPLSDRRIHYALLNDPPLKHASKPASQYDNTKASYKALTDLLTRARLFGEIPMEAISDETRPVTEWQVYPDTAPFIRAQFNGFLRGYHRDLMRSQPCHIELLAEKNTVHPIVQSVASDYCIPVTSGRGFASLPPRAVMADRFEKSGKDRLVLLIVSDFDPDGEEIAHSFARSMRDDFGVDDIHPIKVALTLEQVRERALPLHMEAKATSPNYRRFVEQYGNHVAELEALPPDDLEEIIRDAVDSVIDHDVLEAEIDAEREDAARLEGIHRRVRDVLAALDLEGEEGDND